MDELVSRVRKWRKAAGMSQQRLADRAQVSRQAIVAIEKGRQVPSTSLALLLARALGCRVEDLFELSRPDALQARATDAVRSSERVKLGRVDGRWVAHPLPEPTNCGDGIAGAVGSDGVAVEPLSDVRQLERVALTAGCAPLLANLTRRVERRYGDVRATWLPTSSGRALDLLADGMVHVAGVHLSGEDVAPHAQIVAERLRDEPVSIVNLTLWRQGLVVAPGNPLGIASVGDLLRDDVRVVLREQSSGAMRLLARLLDDAGFEQRPSGAVARHHTDVARHVRWGIADTGVAIEAVALEWGLEFIPLSAERFDLIVPQRHLDRPAVSRLFDALDDRGFRRDMEGTMGYDSTRTGDWTQVDPR